MSLFSPPAGGGDIVKPEALLNHVLIVKPIDFRPDFSTAYGVTDAISADVVDLSEAGEDGQPRVYNGAMFFNVMLVNGLKSQIGELVLARMVQGLAKVGQSAPWQLQDASGDAAVVAAATAWITSHPEFQGLTAPAAPAPAPVLIQPPVAPPVAAPVLPPVAAPAPAPVLVQPPVPIVPSAPVLPAATPTMTFAPVPAAPGLPAEVTPEVLALIAQMQATGQMPVANTAH